MRLTIAVLLATTVGCGGADAPTAGDRAPTRTEAPSQDTDECSETDRLRLDLLETEDRQLQAEIGPLMAATQGAQGSDPIDHPAYQRQMDIARRKSEIYNEKGSLPSECR